MVCPKKITWTVLKSERVDIAAQLNLLKPAFDGSDSPKVEFDMVKDGVLDKSASFYLVKGQDTTLRFLGRVIDGQYHIIAMTGRGLGFAANNIIEQVTSAGYTAITFHTYRKGMRRILRSFGFEQIDCVREFGTKKETVHRLDLKGEHYG